jgi:hypothetical protein
MHFATPMQKKTYHHHHQQRREKQGEGRSQSTSAAPGHNRKPPQTVQTQQMDPSWRCRVFQAAAAVEMQEKSKQQQRKGMDGNHSSKSHPPNLVA